nr:hypothetical protein [Psychrobacter sp. SZ93C1]
MPSVPTVTGDPIGSPASLVKVMVSPAVPVPVMVNPAAASVPLTMSSPVIASMIGAAGAVLSPVLESPPEPPPESAAPANPRPANPASHGNAPKPSNSVAPTHQGVAYPSPPNA